MPDIHYLNVMKKSMLLICLAVLMTAAGCKKEFIVPNRTIITSLNPGNWIPMNGGRTYSASIDMPEIDDYFHDYGAVLVYVSFDDQTYEQVPQVYNGIAYSYVSRRGQIVLEIQSSDGVGTVTPPGAIRVKIVLVESA